MVPYLAGNAGCFFQLARRARSFAGVPPHVRQYRGRVNLSPEENLPDLPPYSLDVQAMDLGADTKAVGLELIETESREPVRGEEAAAIWARAFPALANQ